MPVFSGDHCSHPISYHKCFSFLLASSFRCQAKKKTNKKCCSIWKFQKQHLTETTGRQNWQTFTFCLASGLKFWLLHQSIGCCFYNIFHIRQKTREITPELISCLLPVWDPSLCDICVTLGSANITQWSTQACRLISYITSIQTLTCRPINTSGKCEQYHIFRIWARKHSTIDVRTAVLYSVCN